MKPLADLRRYGRFALRLREALRHPITLEAARDTVRRRIAERDDNFLRTVEHAIYRNPRSPYLPLLRRAGLEIGAIRDMVRAEGMEQALQRLRRSGVYVTLDEFKGRAPIVRDGFVLPVTAGDFDNPNLAPDFHGDSGGTTGPGTRVGISLDGLVAGAPHFLLAYEAHGILGVPRALWRGVLPDATGVNLLLRGGALFGQVPVKWFTPFSSRDRTLSGRARLATQVILAIGRLSGVPLPRPERVTLEQAVVLARWAVETSRIHGGCVINCNVSNALRVCLAAREHQLDLQGTTLMGGGEPPTPAKVRQITSTGARWIPTYAFTEAGPAGVGCARPTGGEDVHLLMDVLALIQAPREVAGTGFTVPAFYFTSLLPTANKIMLNAEIGDYGVVENRPCGCRLEDYGLTVHLRQIRSFGKLTSEGMALLERDIVRILEEVLPARFGGSPLDYQIVEEEDTEGFTRLNLLVSPRIPIADDAEVVAAVLEHLVGGPHTMWAQARTVRVRRIEPIVTSRGKMTPLHLAKRTER